MANQDRTEQPTAKRRNDARKKGQVPRSSDLTQAIALLAALAMLAFSGGPMMGILADAVAQGLGRGGRLAAHDLRPEDVSLLVFEGLRTLAMIVGPVAAVAALATIASQLMQGGWVFASEALHLNWERLSPANGIKKLGFTKEGINALKLLVVTVVIGFIAYRIVRDLIVSSTELSHKAPVDAARAAWGYADALMRQCGFALLAFAGADYGFQRWRHLSSLKMTKQEVKDDLKHTEGNPEIKARVRRIQFSMVRRRMLKAVPKSTVVITNPTHYAVALVYMRGEMAAPRVVAKGRNLIAARIKEIARQNGVPIVENVPLARALYKTAEVGETIPADLFSAVAEVLAYLIRLNQLVL